MGKKTELPSPQQVEAERARLRYRRRYRGTLRSTLSILVVAAAAAILVATLWMPVLQIYGSSMSPTVEEGEIVVSLKGPELRQGEIIAFYYNNKILVKRIIAGPGQWVDMDEDGSVRVDGELLADERWFVMGDHRATSVDSRTTAIGCVAEEQIVGRIVFRVWPFRALGPVR